MEVYCDLVGRLTETPLELITDKNAITEFKYGAVADSEAVVLRAL